MPRKRSFRKSRRRPARKVHRRRAAKTTVSVLKSLNPIPARMISRVKYNTEWSGSIAAGTPNETLFNLNSVWDPERTGVGHQPYGRDTYATMYNKYRVFKCAWRIDIVASNYCRTVVIPQNHANTTGNRTLLAEFPRAIIKHQTTAGVPMKFVGHCYLPGIAGVTSRTYAGSDDYAAAMGTSPAEVMTLNVAVTSSASAGSITFEGNITLTYWVEWFDPIELGQS